MQLATASHLTPVAVKTAVDDATRQLAQTGRTDSPRLDAQVLMTFVLDWPRSRLFAHWDQPLGYPDFDRYQALVDRRVRGEPVAYIRNLKEFLGLDFYVDPRVLIPRPETELLVSHAIAWLQARQGSGQVPLLVADIGTGSGAVAVGILKSCPTVRLVASDVSADALEVARLNARRHAVEPVFRHGSVLEPLAEPADLIVANLPYLSRDEYDSLRHTSIAFEPRQALTDERDGLRLFDELLRQAPAKLRPHGSLLLEIGCTQPDRLRELAASFESTIFRDYAGLPRVLRLDR